MKPRIATVIRQCAECGADLPPRWPRALCGRCALAGALQPAQDAPEPSRLQPGRLVDRRFTLRERIAAGGMGEVWLADDGFLEEPVALKFLHPDLQADPAALAELRRETARSRRLLHPNIVRVFDFHQSEADGAYLSMEYARGISLQRLRLDCEGHRFTWRFLHPLVLQLCAALQHAHHEQIIHRDLKPANLILNSEGTLKLADFGVAAVVIDPTVRISASLRRTGTPHYMSPQQLSSLTPQPSDDFYSLGATLYDLLCGQPPFFEGDLAQQIRDAQPPPLGRRLRDLKASHDVPKHVEALIMACLAKRPERRPRSAEAIAQWIGPELRRGGLPSRLRGWLNRLRATSRPGGPA